ncbi:Holliday junction ATP-dependent DNA helicase RuvB [Candidatus Entotheonellaceae bacterium PAL068K]
MGYQVTARKWRPQSFDDIVEQRHVTRTLMNAIRLARVAHAYLFAGTRGVGKTTTARVLAKALNCEQGPTADPCNACQSCVEITQGTSLDIIEIDGASNRGIDEIRDLREHLRYLPSRGRYKVYIIDEVHMLTKEAFNALLKTLEEPPPHVVFVFATTELEKLPYTILSRCQRFEFKRVSLAGIIKQLEHITQTEGATISRATLTRIAKAAEGSMRDAQSLLDQVVAFCSLEVQDDNVNQLLGTVGSDRLIQCLTALFQQDAATALRYVDALQTEGYETVRIVRALLEALRHLTVLKTTEDPKDLLPVSEVDLDALRSTADLVTVEELYGHFHILSEAEASLRYTGNPFLILEMTLVRMACIGRVQPLQRILDQLQALEAGLPSPATPLPSSSPKKVEDTDALADLVPETRSEPATRVTETISSPSPTPAESFWDSLREYIDKKRPSLAAFLQDGQVLAYTEEELVIGFASQERFSYTSLRDPDNLVVVREAVQAVSGRSLRVKIKMHDDTAAADPTGEVAAADPDTLPTAALQKKKREAIQAVLDIFDGRIIV